MYLHYCTQQQQTALVTRSAAQRNISDMDRRCERTFDSGISPVRARV